MKFVMTQAVCPEGMALLKGVADVYVADNADPNNYLEQMQDADALIVRIAKCDANAITGSPNLKVIGRTGVGYDSVDHFSRTFKSTHNMSPQAYRRLTTKRGLRTLAASAVKGEGAEKNAKTEKE